MQVIADLEAHLLDGGSSHIHTPSVPFNFPKSKARQVGSSTAKWTSSFCQVPSLERLATGRAVPEGSGLLSFTSHPALLPDCLPTTQWQRSSTDFSTCCFSGSLDFDLISQLSLYRALIVPKASLTIVDVIPMINPMFHVTNPIIPAPLLWSKLIHPCSPLISLSETCHHVKTHFKYHFLINPFLTDIVVSSFQTLDRFIVYLLLAIYPILFPILYKLYHKLLHSYLIFHNDLQILTLQGLCLCDCILISISHQCLASRRFSEMLIVQKSKWIIHATAPFSITQVTETLRYCVCRWGVASLRGDYF